MAGEVAEAGEADVDEEVGVAAGYHVDADGGDWTGEVSGMEERREGERERGWLVTKT